ncbi:MAG: response regulator [bacterium]|nr:response regulator [bacterium]
MSRKILIIEDDLFLRELMSKKLVGEGYQISGATDGEEGIRSVKSEKPDLVLLDLILPGIDGFEVLARIKQDPEIAQTPVIVLSNLGQKEDIERGIKLGAVDYLIKAHFTPGEIVEKIASVFSKDI